MSQTNKTGGVNPKYSRTGARKPLSPKSIPGRVGTSVRGYDYTLDREVAKGRSRQEKVSSQNTPSGVKRVKRENISDARSRGFAQAKEKYITGKAPVKATMPKKDQDKITKTKSNKRTNK